MSATPPRSTNAWVAARGERRRTLSLSRQEAAASALTTATSDNFLNAFAVHLNATALQLGTLAAIPQLAGAAFQFAALWLDRLGPRRTLVVGSALLQGAAVALIAVQAAGGLAQSVALLLAFAVLNHAALNLGQPYWRAWLGRIVPPRARGSFFAGRTRLVMLMSVLVFLGGGWLLAAGAQAGLVGAGFAALFGFAATGRVFAARAMARMHDPDDGAALLAPAAMQGTLLRIREALTDPVFRDYTFFVAAFHGAVAFTAPFFTVYMLRDLQFTYLEFALNSVTSIATQFAMLSFWGRVGDRHGNLLLFRLTSWAIVVLPLLWTLSPSFWYLLGVQVCAGIAWSGFSLAAGNYLYDIRPHHSNFATYAAVQAGISAMCVCIGALLGGVVAERMPVLLALLPDPLAAVPSVLGVFVAGTFLRSLVVGWFLPRITVPHVRRHPRLMQLVFRIAQINSISGVVLDWLTVARRSDRKRDDNR